ncbi:50S ribosomal protein L18 [uncultured archaeon]|nr:50S ribosomal protein L18 [uncultured archaeon]
MKVQKRRRMENKTDYGKREKLLKSHGPRLVFRKTNRYVLGQYVISKNAQDLVQIGATSKDLLAYGWPKEFEGSLKSLTASYLTGMLIAKKIVSQKLPSPILDLGMLRILHKTKIYAFIKGVNDGGVKIKCDPSLFPDEERIKGKYLKKDFSKTFDAIKSKIMGAK